MSTEILKVIQEMRDRKIDHGRESSPTLEAWADRLEAALPQQDDPTDAFTAADMASAAAQGFRDGQAAAEQAAAQAEPDHVEDMRAMVEPAPAQDEREAATDAAYAAVVDGGWSSVKEMGVKMFQAGAEWVRAASIGQTEQPMAWRDETGTLYPSRESVAKYLPEGRIATPLYAASIAQTASQQVALCEDEGCPHHGTEHVCRSVPPLKPRRTLLAQAESFGAYLTGAPDGSFPVTLVFPIESWRKFDAHLLASSTPQWLLIETAPKDGTLLRLLVDFERHATEDSAGPTPTIGANGCLNDGEDVWKFAGWDWGCDCFTEGEGVPVGWLPLHAPSFEQAQPALTVWEGTMPESNGKTNFTAVLMRRDAKGFEGFTEGFTIQISEYPDRVRYEADRVRYLIGELDEAPDILAYDPDKHSGYVRPTKEKP